MSNDISMDIKLRKYFVHIFSGSKVGFEIFYNFFRGLVLRIKTGSHNNFINNVLSIHNNFFIPFKLVFLLILQTM